MSGYITFWSKDYVKQLEKHKDNGPFCVVYGSQHTKMPSISSLKTGDIIYPVAIKDKTLCVMARLPIEKIESAYDYLIRETGGYYSALIPEGILIQNLVIKPHKFHQEPITCCANIAASGTCGSSIEARLIPLENVSTFLFGKTKSTQKPLRLDKNGNLTSISLSGFVRKMSDETFHYFEEMFN